MLVLTRNGDFYGFIGQGTGKFVDGVEVCVGDIVRVEAGENHHSNENVVGLFTNKYSVMGYACDPISNLEISKIVLSHKELKMYDSVLNYFKVVSFIN